LASSGFSVKRIRYCAAMLVSFGKFLTYPAGAHLRKYDQCSINLTPRRQSKANGIQTFGASKNTRWPPHNLLGAATAFRYDVFREGVGALSYIKRAAGILLGALLLGLIIFAWAFATGGIASYVERAWCWSATQPANCHFRGGWTFLVWCVIGVVNILIVGFLLERIGEERNRHR
jgi:hypothetical protein